MNPNDNVDRFGRFLPIAIVIVVAVSLYLVISSVIVARTTGTLHVSASATKALLSITQNNRDAELIGVGTTAVRLKPGTYEVAAHDGGRQVNKVIHIKTGSTITVSLDLSDSQQLRSSNSITFSGTGAMTDYGVSSVQVNGFKRALFRYSPDAKLVVVSNIVPVPHNRNSPSTVDTLTFDVKIDNSPQYKARVEYSLLSDNVRLLLYNSNGVLVFDSQQVTLGGD